MIPLGVSIWSNRRWNQYPYSISTYCDTDDYYT
jgi:hypothetical protein